MKMLKEEVDRFPFGVWIAIVALLALFLGWGMQAYSLFNWDGALYLGLQNERFTGDAAERAWAQESWGVAMADMLWPLPIGIVAFIYFPLVFAFQRWATYPETVVAAIFLWTIPSLLGIIGLWENREYFDE